MGARTRGIVESLRRQPFLVAFAAMSAGSAALLLHYRSELSFMLDDWAFVVYRHEGTAGDFLDPHNEHISIVPVAIYKLFLGIFGMTSAMPLHIVSLAAFLVSVTVLLIYLRPLVGDAAAAIGCGVILFFGAAWEDLLWIFQIGFSISIACGIGALIMLRREDRLGDRMACLLLTVSIASTSMGIPFAAGALADLAFRRRDLLRRAYVVLVPLLLYAGWYAGWGHQAESSLGFDNVIGVPEYVAGSFTLAIGELTGIFRLPDGPERVLSAIVAVGVVGFGIWSMRSRRRLPRAFLVAVAVGLAFWVLAAVNEAPGRGFQVSRYQFPSAVFVLMIVAGAFEGLRARPRFLAGFAAVALVAIVANVLELRDGYRETFKPISDKGIAGLTAFHLARATADPDLAVGMNADDTAKVGAGAYFEAEDRYGSAAWGRTEIERAGPDARRRLDETLVAALPIASRPAREGEGSGTCINLGAAPGGGPSAPAPESAFTYRPAKDAILMVGRFSEGTAVGAGITEAGAETLVTIPRDESDSPWRIAFAGAGEVRVCAAGAGLVSPGTSGSPRG